MADGITINFGHILTIILIIAGFVMQWILFSNRISRFEGYTKAKIEALEKMLSMLFSFIKKCKHISGDNSED